MKTIINPKADARLHLPCVQTAKDSPARLLAYEHIAGDRH